MLGGPRVVHDLILTRAWDRRLRGQRQKMGGEVQVGVSPLEKTKCKDAIKAVDWGNGSYQM